MKKVLHLLNTSSFSGAENVACQIIDIYRGDDKVEMVYCSLDGSIRDAVEEKGIKFTPLEKMSVKCLRKVIKKEKPDIIHAHDMRASFIAALACKRESLVSHIHNNALDARELSLKSIAYILAGIKAQKIIWVSKSALEGYAFKGLFKKKSVVLKNMINIDELYRKMATDSNSYHYDVVYIGRLSAAKNPERLMKVLSMIAEKKPDVQIAVVGNGELEEATRRQAKELSLENNIHFLGFCKNPYKILKDSKVMIMTSLWEGLPMCVLEAMALGVPVVSTPTDGVAEVITDGESGFLSDCDEQLKERCLQLITDEELRSRMSDKAKEKAFEINDICSYKNELKDCYQESKE